MAKKEKIKVTCYGETEIWTNRQKALEFYYEAILNSDGSERERYKNIYAELKFGLKECSDGEEPIPMIGVIYNHKGLCEHNYLFKNAYDFKKHFNRENLANWEVAANKTYTVLELNEVCDEVEEFINGKFNDIPEDNTDWYWDIDIELIKSYPGFFEELSKKYPKFKKIIKS